MMTQRLFFFQNHRFLNRKMVIILFIIVIIIVFHLHLTIIFVSECSGPFISYRSLLLSQIQKVLIN